MISRNTIPLYILLVLSLPFFSGCSPYFHKLDLTSGGRTTDSLAGIMEAEYPFTTHKQIDWELFSNRLGSLFPLSGPGDDDYLKIRDLIYKLPDARINITGKKDRYLIKEETSGYLGFDLAHHPPDQYFVSRIDSQSDAWAKGIRAGDMIVGWNRMHIKEAVSSFPLRWGYHPAHNEKRLLLSCHYMSRGKRGSSVEIFFVNEQGNNKGVRISYEKDSFNPVPQYLGIIGKDNDRKKEFKFV